jgi:hypothetical protein
MLLVDIYSIIEDSNFFLQILPCMKNKFEDYFKS